MVHFVDIGGIIDHHCINFLTLAMIYEELGDIDKSMQVYLCSTILYQFK
jgi:hypothetical protein